MNELTPLPQQSTGYSATPESAAMTVELAKMLKLVAPISMSADAQMVWLQAALDALEDIRAIEVAGISAELRRSVTRPSQIVPEIAKLVHERRQQSQRSAPASESQCREIDISREAEKRRAAARGREQLNAVWEWERQARIDAGLSVRPRPAPFSREELDRMDPQTRKMGLNCGFLEYRDGKLCEVA